MKYFIVDDDPIRVETYRRCLAIIDPGCRAKAYSEKDVIERKFMNGAPLIFVWMPSLKQAPELIRKARNQGGSKRLVFCHEQEAYQREAEDHAGLAQGIAVSIHDVTAMAQKVQIHLKAITKH